MLLFFYLISINIDYLSVNNSYGRKTIVTIAGFYKEVK